MVFLILSMVFIGSSLKVDERELITKIAFGSCANRFSQRNPELFASITSWKPDLFIWLGDSIYADRYTFPERFKVNDFTIWENLYTSAKQQPEYSQLINTTMITGIWDDHDFGINDGNKSFPYKSESKSLFLDFIDDGSNRTHEGIYHSFSFPNLKLILLDTRWFRDSKKDEDGDTLGEKQWIWLESQLKSNETVKILASGIQMNTHDRGWPAERWHRRSRERLWKLIDENHGVILLSGDVHYAEIFKFPCTAYDSYEVTSSGLTHSVADTYGPISAVILNLLHPFTFNIGPKYLNRNFGSLEIDWESSTIQISIRNSSGSPQLSHTFPISSLSSPSTTFCPETPTFLSTHFLSSLLLFLLPPSLLSLSLLIFLRKLSNTY